jgi:Protein of unknown function (DUF992)
MKSSVLIARALQLVIAAGAISALAIGLAQAKTRLQAGTLTCHGDGGWGAIITSKKKFDCVFTNTRNEPVGRYKAVVRKFGLDIGVTGKTALQWSIFGPAKKVGKEWVVGSLQGEYAGVGADASAGVGLGANALVGGGPDSFALQPISVQVQTGISIAAGVQTMVLTYVGPAS